MALWVASGDGGFRARLGAGQWNGSAVLRRMAQSDFAEGRSGEVVLRDRSSKEVRALAHFFAGTLTSAELGGLSLSLLALADYLDIPALEEAAVAAAAESLERIQDWGLTPARLVARVLEHASGLGLLHAEQLGHGLLDKEAYERSLAQAWANASVNRGDTVEALVRRQVARFTPRNAATLQGLVALHGAHVCRLRIASRALLASDQLEGVVKQLPNLEALDMAGNELGESELENIVRALARAGKGRPKDRASLQIGLADTGISAAGLDRFVAAIADARPLGRGTARHKPARLRKGAALRVGLDLRENPIGDAGLGILGGAIAGAACLPALCLDLSSNAQLGPDGLQPLARAVAAHTLKVRELVLSAGSYDVSNVLETLFGGRRQQQRLTEEESATLQVLDLSRNFARLAPEAVRALASSTRAAKLRSLDLGGNRCEPKAVAVLTEGLRAGAFAALRQIGLSNVGLDEQGGLALSKALGECDNVRAVDVSRNALTDRATASFAVLAGGHASLTALNVSGNSCNVLVAGAFAAAIAKRPGGIEDLAFQAADWQNRMREQGCAVLCRGLLSVLRAPIGLRSLDLSGQAIKCKGCVLLSNVVDRDAAASLRRLVLRRNDILGPGALELASAMQRKSKRRGRLGEKLHLNLLGNDIAHNLQDEISSICAGLVEVLMTRIAD